MPEPRGGIILLLLIRCAVECEVKERHQISRKSGGGRAHFLSAAYSSLSCLMCICKQREGVGYITFSFGNQRNQDSFIRKEVMNK